MVFSSILFLFFFLPTALALYFASPRRVRPLTLTLVSYAFYAWSDPRFLLLLGWVTVADFTIGNLLGRRHALGDRARRWLLALSLANSIGLLAYFKYAVLAHDLAGRVSEAMGGAAWPVLAVVLPAGISFYTFESISYVVDVYRGRARPAGERFARAVPVAHRTPWRRALAQGRGLVAFACYLAQFPHLVAGPIIRYQELEPQLLRPRIGLERFVRGAMLLSFGLAKKVLIANTLAPAVDLAFAEPVYTSGDAWLCLVAFAFQLYFDFSGYSDMACGLALMLGFDFPRNFDAPYRAASVTEFWRRWHMTLSRWLRDYLYIPLGGNRRGRARTYANLLLTMLLGGLWHGASLNFAVWGLWHGALLAIERAAGWAEPAPRHAAVRALRVAATFALVTLGWAIFRSANLTAAVALLTQLVASITPETPEGLRSLLHAPTTRAALVGGAILAFAAPQAFDLCRRVTPLRATLALALFAVATAVLSAQSSNPFLYFRF